MTDENKNWKVEPGQISDAPATWNYYTWTEFFNKEECRLISEFIDNNWHREEKKEDGAGVTGDKRRISSVTRIHYGHVKHLISNLVERAYKITNAEFGFKTFGPYDIDELLWNTYTSDDKDRYDWHFDESRVTTYSTKMTLLINLSPEPYTGGEFQTYTYNEDNHPDYDKPGSAIMFKSHFNHRVLPMTSGTRKTLALFLCGPRLT